MHPALVALGVLLLGLVLNAAWALATARPHTPTTRESASPVNPLDAIARGLQPFVGRHPDGTSHAFTRPAAAGSHACDSVAYCHHAALACRCGATLLRGHSVPEVR